MRAMILGLSSRDIVPLGQEVFRDLRDVLTMFGRCWESGRRVISVLEPTYENIIYIRVSAQDDIL